MDRKGGLPRVARFVAATLIAALLALAPVSAAGAGAAPKHSSPTCSLVGHLPRGDVVVAVVVDFGSPGDRVVVSCLAARPGTSGAQILSQQASQVGAPMPRYNTSGLLCAIDGYPKAGCGTEVGGHYAYWAYWHGGRSWTYAELGPSEWQVTKGDVEGWRFEPHGSASPADPAPRASPLAARLEVPAGRTAVPTATGAAAHSTSTHRGAPVPFLVAAVAVVALGAAAVARTRRRDARTI